VIRLRIDVDALIAIDTPGAVAVKALLPFAEPLTDFEVNVALPPSTAIGQ